MLSSFERELRYAVEQVPSLAGDSKATEQVLDRFRDKYLHTIRKATRPAARERAWDSFRYYMVVPATTRKPFRLSDEEADTLLAELRRLVRATEIGLQEDDDERRAQSVADR